MSEWKQPELRVGDLVLYYSNPINPVEPLLGFVVERPGKTSISILAFGQSTGFIEKKSVRHKDDPFWKEDESANAWHKWGCYTLHPLTEMMPVMKKLITAMKIEESRTKAKKAGNK